MHELKRRLDSGELTPSQYREEAKKIKEKYKILHEAVQEDVISGNEGQKILKSGRKYKTDENNDINFEGTDSPSLEQDRLEDTNFLSRATHWIKEKLHTERFLNAASETSLLLWE